MPNLELEQHLAAVRKELEACDSANYVACAQSVVHLKAVMEAFDKMQDDLAQLVQLYVGLMHSSGKLLFFVKRLLNTRRKSNKGRSFVATFTLDELQTVADECEKRNDETDKAMNTATKETPCPPTPKN